MIIILDQHFCSNLLRSLNFDMGSPVNRFVVFARAAARGAYMSEHGYSSDHKHKYGIFERGADKKRASTWSDSIRAWKEQFMFEFHLSMHSWRQSFINLFFRVGIFLGFLKPVNIQELLDEGYAPG